MSISKGTKGAAGVNFVAAELSMLGKVALPTTRNVKGPDIVVFDPETLKAVFIQVKSTDKPNSGWMVPPLGADVTDWEAVFRRTVVPGENYFYVFVALPSDKQPQPLYYIVPSAEMADSIVRDTKFYHSQKDTKPKPHEPMAWAYFDKDGGLKAKYLNRWDLLNLEKPGP